MYKNHLNLQDIKIGDWVQEYSEITDNFSMPMYVSAIFADGTVYLDFNGNEGDVWETNIENIAPITIDKNMMEGFGFELDFNFDTIGFKLSIGDSHIYIHRFQYNFNKSFFQIDEDVRFFGKWVLQVGENIKFNSFCCYYIHDLQHAYYKYRHKPLVLNWRGV